MLIKKSALVLAASLVAISGAQAVPTVTTNFPVNITVSAVDPATTCTVTTNGYATPSYTSNAATLSQVFNSGVVTCTGTNPVGYTVSADAGGNALGGSRRAASGGNFINYNLMLGGTSILHFDALPALFGGSQIFGSTVVGAGNASTFNFRLVVPAGQTAATGSYTDSVVLTTTF
jgi:spore coat protein U-like protein